MNNNNDGGCLAAILAFMFIGGNIFLFTGALTDDLNDNGFAWIMVVVAIIADLVIFCWLASKVVTAIRKKYENNKTDKLAQNKEYVVKEISGIISYKQEIQNILNRHFEKIERQFSLMSLISSCMGNNNQELNNMLINNKEEAFSGTKNEILGKLSEFDKQRFPKSVDGVAYYKKILEQEISDLKTDLTFVDTCDEEQLSEMIKKYCPEVHKSIKRKRIKLIARIVIPIIIIITLICSFCFIKNIPYRELHSMIEKQSLTAEMLSWNGSYYDYIQSEKGYKFLVSELTKLHKVNDIKKAMWLLCIQPDCIDGIDACASDSFIDWIVDYGLKNGTTKTDSEGNTTYYIDGYEIDISSIFDNYIGHYFRISNGKDSTTVDRKNTYHKGYVPTIQ